MRHIRAALRCEHLTNRRNLYETWIESEWDAPAVLFGLEDIRNIIERHDDAFSGHYISDQLLRTLVATHRGLKGVCARVRPLVRGVMQDIVLPNYHAATKPQFSKDNVDTIVAAVDASVNALLSTHFEGIPGLSFDGFRIGGTNVEQVRKPRCI